ncbi:MAG: S-adenosylmethionine decarboxylase [Salinivirgaceae bacterium]|jgi:S-adenosylmethionine decarboxylase|nr:S-adenosylmethionine decarboxylase [Salinivirgaceae bacterium]
MKQNTTVIENVEVKAVVYNFQQWINITDADILHKKFSNLLAVSGYRVLNFIEHKFPNGGYTCLWLLAESHLAIHTFITEGKTYIELSGCNKQMNIVFREEFNKRFKSNILA